MARRWAALLLLLAFLLALAVVGLCTPETHADHKPGHTLPPGHATHTAEAAIGTPTPTASPSRTRVAPPAPSATATSTPVPTGTTVVLPAPITSPSTTATPTPHPPRRLYLPFWSVA